MASNEQEQRMTRRDFIIKGTFAGSLALGSSFSFHALYTLANTILESQQQANKIYPPVPPETLQKAEKTITEAYSDLSTQIDQTLLQNPNSDRVGVEVYNAQKLRTALTAKQQNTNNKDLQTKLLNEDHQSVSTVNRDSYIALASLAVSALTLPIVMIKDTKNQLQKRMQDHSQPTDENSRA